MALSSKLWPFSTLSNEKREKTPFLPKTISMNSTLFGASTCDDEILEQLNSPDFEMRLRTLNRLRNLALGHELWFKRFTKKLELFKSFANVLSDTNWEVQHQCIKFLNDTMNDYGNDLEWCMAIIFPYLVPKLASPKITVRRVCSQCLINYVKRVDGVHAFQKAIIQYGLPKMDKNLATEILKEIPNLFVPEFRIYSWSILTEGLMEFLYTSPGDRELSDLVLTVLERLLNLVGQQQFNNYIHNLPPNKKTCYEELLIRRGVRSNTGYGMVSSTKLDDFDAPTPVTTSGKQFRYGFIPVSLVDELNNETDWQTRYEGLEKLKTLVENMTDADMKKLQPHLFSFINLLSNILDDLNIKIIVLALDVVRESVTQMRRYVEPHLQHVVAAMAKHLGNQKAVVKQLNLSIVLELMRHLHPKPVFAVLCGYLQHRNSRVREEVLNIVTIALLTHASTEFNISAVAHIISPLLADAKRRVRLAAFECFAVLSNCVGSGKMETIMKHVREVEETRSAPGLVQAVQSRLSRNQLPKIRYDGLLEYTALPISPSGEDSRKYSDVSAVHSADIEWIMSAGIGQGSSAVSRSLSPIRFRSTTAMEKQSIAQPTQQQPRQQTPSAARRVLSAGRNLRKLPWETSQDDRLSNVQQQQQERGNNRSAPVRPNDTSASPDSQQRPPPARPIKLVDHLSNTEDQSKTFVPPIAKANQHVANGKLVLSPLQANGRNSSVVNNYSRGVVAVTERSKSRIASPLAEDELSPSWNTVGHKVEEQNFNKQDTLKKAQSFSVLPNVSMADYRNSWDETPIKPASKEQLETYFGDALSSVPSTGARSSSNATAINSQKNLISDRPKGIADERRASVDSSDMQSPRTNAESVVRKAPVLAKRTSSFKKPSAASTLRNRSLAPASRKAPSDIISVNNDRQYSNPHQALNNALKKLASDEWTDKIEGINSIERLARFHSNVLAAEIQPVIIALNNEARNLRSSVSKQALECYCNLFKYLQRSMDSEVERVCTVLMAKTGDTSNAFTREGATRALESMVDHVSPHKSLWWLVATGASHKSATVRSACSQLVLRLVETMGAAKVLSSQTEFVEKILLTATQFSNDNQPQPRYYGKAILAFLSKDAEFGRTVARCLTETQQRTVFSLVDNVKSKGLGGSFSGSSLSAALNGSASSTGKNGAIGRNGSIRRKTRLPDEAVDSFLAAEKELMSNTGEERLKGVNRLYKLSQSYGKTISGDVKLMEMYMARLNDINGKVAVQALQWLPSLLSNLSPHLGEVVRPIATEIVKCLSAQLPSKNDDIRRMAQNGLDCAVNYLDNSALIQPLSIAVKTGNVKQKPDLLNTLGKVSQNIFSTKPKLVQMHALPVLFDLIKSQQADPCLKQAAIDYARTLARLTGARALVDAASQLSPDQKLELEDMLT